MFFNIEKVKMHKESINILCSLTSDFCLLLCYNTGVYKVGVGFMKKTQIYKYSNYIKRMILLCLLLPVVPLVCFLTKEENETIEVVYIVLPIVFIAVATFFLYFSRRLMLSILVAKDLDFRVVYELDKRKNNELHNLNLESNMYFYEGDFDKAIVACEKIMKLSSKKEDVYSATTQIIISKFFDSCSGDLDKSILDLIYTQRKFEADNNLRGNKLANQYYTYIENYISEEYEKAINSIKSLLEEEGVETFNSRMVVICAMLVLAYKKLEDEDKANYYIDKLLSADPNKKTVFSRSALIC